jgi:hypothetical protein
MLGMEMGIAACSGWGGKLWRTPVERKRQRNRHLKDKLGKKDRDNSSAVTDT